MNRPPLDYQAFIEAYPRFTEELEERAAIMEYHGGMNRERAENMAMLRIIDKYDLWRKE